MLKKDNADNRNIFQLIKGIRDEHGNSLQSIWRRVDQGFNSLGVPNPDCDLPYIPRGQKFKHSMPKTNNKSSSVVKAASNNNVGEGSGRTPRGPKGSLGKRAKPEVPRARSQGPSPGKRPITVSKPADKGALACLFCRDMSCDNPTRCAMSYDWDSRIAVHQRAQLCPQFTCLKAHRGRCWRMGTVACSFCDKPHHLAWCKDLALSQVRSNCGSEPYSP